MLAHLSYSPHMNLFKSSRESNYTFSRLFRQWALMAQVTGEDISLGHLIDSYSKSPKDARYARYLHLVRQDISIGVEPIVALIHHGELLPQAALDALFETKVNETFTETLIRVADATRAVYSPNLTEEQVEVPSAV